MSFGQGGPSWGGPGSSGHDPYGAQKPYGSRNTRGSRDAYGSQHANRSSDQYGTPEPYSSTPDPYATPDPYVTPDPYASQDAYAARTPDWGALADESAARTRRKRWLLIGGGAVATATVAAIVATAVVSMNGDGQNTASGQSATELPSTVTDPTGQGSTAGPSFPSAEPLPPPNPKDYVSSADKDKAPLSADTLYPGRRLAMGGRLYMKGATTHTTNCAASAQGSLGSILAANSCDQVIRATYSKDGVAVTVGVAVFDKEAQALKAKDQAEGGIASLSGAGVPTFCRAPSVCRRTTNSYGRYLYFTVGGFTNGKNVTTSDKDVYTTGDDIAEFTFRQILGRGRAQASAAATAPVER
nr:hypothetical protein OH820_21370 [Streptomyces sp. NBC_00857]